MSPATSDRIEPAYRDIAEHIAAGRFEASAPALQQALDRDGPQPSLLRLLAYHLDGMGQFDQAYPLYKQIASSAEPDAALCLRLARCCLLLGRPHEANALAKTLADALHAESEGRCVAAAVLTWKGKWDAARAELDVDIAQLDPIWQRDADCRRQLCDNMIALRERRPDAFGAIAASKPPLHVRKAVDPTGVISIDAYRDKHWVRLYSLMPHAQTLPPNERELLQSCALAFCSLISWPFAKQCYLNRPATLYLTQQQAIHLFESDPQVFYGLAMLEDLRPYIADDRVHWYLGAEFAERFRHTMESDGQLLVPRVTIGNHPGAAQAIEEATRSRDEAMRVLTAETQAYYRSLPADHGRRVFAQSLGRPSRVYLLTTRFSTVLQFVTADVERAFRRLGWETRLAIETDDARVYTEYAILRDLNEFKPDTVFMLDHLRYEWVFQRFPELYHICWIQDQMANLYCTRAGESIGPRDFVLILGSGPDLMHRYHYPRQSLVHMPFCTDLDAHSDADQVDLSAYEIPDVGFASNHGRSPSATLTAVLEGVGPDAPPEVRQLAQPYLEAILRAYESDNPLYEDVQYRELLQQTEAQTGVRLPDEHWRIMLGRTFRLHVGGAVHRQQVLRWLKDAGIKLGIFGRDWDRHPEFAPYARGVVTDSKVMNAIFRATPINLQISQYTNSHIRFWNGLAAGGFFLVRTCPADSGRAAVENVLAFLRKNMGRSKTDIRRTEHRSIWEEVVFGSLFEETIPGHDRIDEYAIDALTMTLQCPTWTEKLGPVADKIQFETRDQCLGMIDRYLKNPAARAEVTAEIRDVLEDQTYEANLRRALATIRDRIG